MTKVSRSAIAGRFVWSRPDGVCDLQEEMTLEGRDVWFFDDTETLRKEWSSANFESVGEL
jgi:hypothetical protein